METPLPLSSDVIIKLLMREIKINAKSIHQKSANLQIFQDIKFFRGQVS